MRKSWTLAFLCSHLARIKEDVELLDAAAADFTEGEPEAERLRLDRAIARLSDAVGALVSGTTRGGPGRSKRHKVDSPVPDCLEKIETRLLHRPCALVAAGASVRCLTTEKREGRISVWNVQTRRMCGECAAYVHVMRARMALTGRGVPEPGADRRSVCGYQGCAATATRPDPFGGRDVCADCEEELKCLLCERPQS